jgi:imidazole glycerol-phosphate synthase subunit HisH
MPRVGIVDYGMGNLRSVEKGLQKVGVDATLCSEAAEFESFDGLVLPGVGAFGDAIEHLRRRGMDRALHDYIGSGRNLLGICLGLQLLFEYSEEHGRNEGLGVIPGRVRRLPDTVKVPHMGWNVLNVTREVPLFDGVESGSRFYFVHSYYCEPSGDDWTIGTTPYGLEFTCAAGIGNVWGLQFHPEKSSLLGLRILENFGGMVAAG